MAISLESVLSTIDVTHNTVKGIKTVCANHEQVTQYVQNPILKQNIKTQAENMFVFIEKCENKVDEVTGDIKKKFGKLTEDILGVTQKYQPWLDELNSWLEIPQLEAEMAERRLGEFANEFPNHSQLFQGSLTDRISLYIEAIQRKIEKLIQKLYDTIQEWVEKAIQKLKEFIDPYLKKLKEFGDKLIGYAKEWLDKALDWVLDSSLGQAVKTGFELAKGVLEMFPEVNVQEFVPGLSLDFQQNKESLENEAGSIGDIMGSIGSQISGALGSLGFGPKEPPDPNAPKPTSEEQKAKEDANKFPQNIEDPDPAKNKEGTFKEGVFTEQDDPNSAKFNAPDGLGIKNTDAGGGTMFVVPTTSFNPQYTKNFPKVTPGGHITELDDTPGNERQFQYHPAGTSSEVQPDGQKVNRIVGSHFEVIEKDGNIQINGICNIQIGGDARISVGGDMYSVVGGNCAQSVKGNISQTVMGNAEQEIKGNAYQQITGDVKSVISGSVIQQIKGNVNQKIDGNNWQQILGNSQQHIKGNVQQITEGSVKQLTKGNVEMQVNGNVDSFIDGTQHIMVQGDLTQIVQGSCIQKINGDLFAGVKGDVVAGISGTLGAKVSGDTTLNLESNVNAQVGGDMTFKVGGTFNLQSAETILQSSGETVIKGSRVSLN